MEICLSEDSLVDNDGIVTNGQQSPIQVKDPIIAQGDPSFYTDAAAYWEKVPPTMDGILGGFPEVSSLDIHDSKYLLESIFRMKNPPGHARALDCGAGIGRVSEALLLRYFGKVDLVEQCSQFLEKAKERFKFSTQIGHYYCVGLQNFTPLPCTYDLIWCQWVLGYLNDKDLEVFLGRLIPGLRPNGVIIIKENICESKIEFDETDSSVTRSECLLLEILKRAGLKVIKNVQQQNFPAYLFEVRMICCTPKYVL